MEKQDLVVLQYAPNNCYLQTVRVDKVPKDSFNVDLEKRVWSFAHWENIPIGKNRPYTNDSRDGVIGVYNARLIQDLDLMISTAVNIIHRMHPSHED